MLISYVIRLRPDALEQGQFVGDIEAVSTRVRSSFRSVQQATAFILATSPDQARRSSELSDDTDGVAARSRDDGGAALQGWEDDRVVLPSPLVSREHR